MKTNRLFIIGFTMLILGGCSFGGYKVDVDLTGDEIAAIKADIEAQQQEIENFVPSNVEGLIAWKAIIKLAKDYEKLGELGEAIKIYEDVLDGEHQTKAILNNLGRLYEKTEQYEKAVAMYQRISDEYVDHGYLYDITWAYIRAGDRKNAEKYFNAWQLEFQKTDEQTQKAIKELRDAKITE